MPRTVHIHVHDSRRKVRDVREHWDSGQKVSINTGLYAYKKGVVHMDAGEECLVKIDGVFGNTRVKKSSMTQDTKTVIADADHTPLKTRLDRWMSAEKAGKTEEAARAKTAYLQLKRHGHDAASVKAPAPKVSHQNTSEQARRIAESLKRSTKDSETITRLHKIQKTHDIILRKRK